MAKPLPVIAKKNFFVKLHLPYSVVRGEQVQIKAVVYNYRSSDATVSLRNLSSYSRQNVLLAEAG